ncbi:MAG: DMT family transporter [Pseudarcicella sp.]|nr:DMT family transporter [Pseudarcicella sp.]MBP6410439.1 DMT family transporter [Pseudarcicella sp.]
MPSQNLSKKAYLLLFLGIFCIGWSAIFVKLSGAPAITTGFYRFFFCFIGIIPIWIYKKISIPDTKTLLFIALGAFAFVADMALWNIAIFTTSASIATLLANNAAIFVGLGAMIIFQQKLSKTYWVGLSIAILGILMVVIKDVINSPAIGLGHFMAIGGAFFYAIYLMFTQKIREKLDTINFMGWSLVFCVFFAFLLCLQQDIKMLNFPTHTWLYFIALGLICHLTGWLSINYSLGHLPASIVSPALLLQPIFTTIFSYLFLNESLRIEQIIGGATVIAGIYLINKGK